MAFSMTVDDFDCLKVARYELRLRACQAVSLPAFLGSTLRGAFGHALKQAVCVIDHRDCARCLLVARCPYPYLFETPAPADEPLLRGQHNAPHPFVLEPPMLGLRAGRVWRLPKRNDEAQAVAATSLAAAERSTFSSGERHNLCAGDTLTFGLLLIGPAITCLPYVVLAVSEMAQRGLGASRGRFALVDVASIDEAGDKQVIYTSDSGRFSSSGIEPRSLRELLRARLAGVEMNEALKLRFATPTRIRVQDELQTGISFELLVRNLLRRISLLIRVHGGTRMEVDFRGLIARAPGVEKCREALRWDDWQRYSNRQQTSMRLGGFVGEIEYRGEALKEYLPLIAAGELLHIGTGTSFGLGKYEMVVSPKEDSL
jgi:hypothetical protein